MKNNGDDGDDDDDSENDAIMMKMPIPEEPNHLQIQIEVECAGPRPLFGTILLYIHRALITALNCTVLDQDQDCRADVEVCDNEIALKSAPNFKIS